MAEANFTDSLCRRDSNNKSNSSNQNLDSDDELPTVEVYPVPADSKIKTDYLHNLLDLPDELKKENLKEKLVPQQQQKPSTSSPHKLSPRAKIQNEEPATSNHHIIDLNIPSSSNQMNNITIEAASKDVREQNSLSDANIVEPMDQSDSQISTGRNLFDRVAQQSNLEQMHNSLQLICDYGSDSDEGDTPVIDLQPAPQATDIITSAESNEKEYLNEYRTSVLFSEDSEDDSDSSDDKSESDSSSTSSSSSSSSSSIATENASAVKRNVSNNAQNNAPKKKNNDNMMTRGEISIEDLPPIEDLCISVPETDCVELGKITNIVNQLVVVQAFKNTPPLDLDSILFLDHGKRPLGQIFDVFGQVSEPLYCVRFNSGDHIKEKGIEKDMTVYCAPKTKHTSYVFVPHLLKMKGSDASWEDNNEPPPKCLDYSDDEEERKARKSLKSNEKKVTDEGSDQPRKKKTRSSSFERRMNERNLRMTALHANQPPATPIRNNTNNNNSNNNNVPRPPFDNTAWWSAPIPPAHSFHRPNRPPPPPCTPTPPRLIQPPTFTLPPPQRFEISPYPMFSSPPPPTFSAPHTTTSGGPGMPPMFPPFQAPPFVFNHSFPPPLPPFDPNRPPPSFGFPPSFPPQIPRHRPPPPP